MAQSLIMTIDTPVAGEEVGLTTPVTGTLTITGSGWPRLTLESVDVRFGAGGQVVVATLGAKVNNQQPFSCSGPLPPGIQGGDPVTLTATAHGFLIPFNSPGVVTGEPAPTDGDPILVGGDAPNLLPGDGEPPPDPDPDPEPDPEPEPEDFEQSVSVTVKLRQPFVPGPVERFFEPTTYLQELLVLAGDHVSVDGASPGPSPANLAARLIQPLDRVTDPAVFEAATAPVQQARIAVEVLRGHIGTTTPAAYAAIDRQHRGLAYEALLRELGTTSSELRLARLAEPATRRSLAARLGIELAATRPDLLDEMTFAPEDVTDAQLEQLFGFRITAPTDPLRPTTDTATILLSRQTSLRSHWRRLDEEERDGDDGPIPVIDPDVIAEHNLRSADQDDPARTLFTARRDAIAASLAEINGAFDVGDRTAKVFDETVLDLVGAIDLTDLADRDAEGEDLTAVLAPFQLSLAAFRFLATFRSLLVAEAAVDSEWQDVAAILVQVGKRRQFAEWRLQERELGIVLQPATFVADEPGAVLTATPWRSDVSTMARWQDTLDARVQEATLLASDFARVVEDAERKALPALRDALVGEIGRQHAENPEQAAERLSRELCIDLRAIGGQRTDRVAQAIDSVQSLLVSARAGLFGSRLTIADEVTFDNEWEWLVAYPRWVSAMRAFAYPENQLQPNLFRREEVSTVQKLDPTNAYLAFTAALTEARRFTPATARKLAADYVAALRPILTAPLTLPSAFVLTDQRTSAQLLAHRAQCAAMVQAARTSTNPITRESQVPQAIRELFWLVPIALAKKLQDAGEYSIALDWYQTVFAYYLPSAQRSVYAGLALDATDSQSSDYQRIPGWLGQGRELNPHFTARKRRGAHLRFTVMSIVECLIGFADSEFARSTPDANARARVLYQSAIDLLGLPEAAMPAQPAVPFPANPFRAALRMTAEVGLAKIHAGLNIGGLTEIAAIEGGDSSVLPSHYRYSVLAERAKNLVSIAQQVEAAYFAALERTDAEAYGLLQAGHDLRVAQASLTIQDLKVSAADLGIRQATVQRDRARVQANTYDDWIDAGRNGHERDSLNLMKIAAGAQAGAMLAHSAAAVVKLFNPNPFADRAGAVANALSAASSMFSQYANIQQTLGSFERREQEWTLQRDLANKDVESGGLQVSLAINQRLIVAQEQALTWEQLTHAEAVAEFLATKFTNAELHQWMSGVLGRVYAYFLQQATVVARLAQAQLAFERQEPPVGFIAGDYWQDAGSVGTETADRRGLTGSARLLQDVHRLDEHAFATDRRKLHMTQTFSLAQVAGVELQRFRETGVLDFATTTEQFDRDFPGHYLRLVKRVRTSLVALVPPVRGIRATLSTSGMSRTVVARGPFDTVTLRREPETIAFTSPAGANGLFDLEAEDGTLLPFEGMGTDAVWRLELPKAANPFDYNTIVDVLFTVEYTALHSDQYRQKVVRRLDRRFTGDRALSLRNEFPDAWYELSNPDTVADPHRRMNAALSLTAADFPPHVEGLAVRDLTLFVVRASANTDELTVTSLTHTAEGTDTIAGEVETTGGIVGTRRPGGAAWQPLTGRSPVGEWRLRFPDTTAVRSAFAEGAIEDVVLVMTLDGTTPAWP